MDYIVFPDIHGEWDRIDKALTKLKNINAKLIFLGDYIDKGNNNLTVINNLINLKLKKPDTIFLKGNHEEFLLGSIDKNNLDCNSELQSELQLDIQKIWIRNGGNKTINEYNIDINNLNIPKEHLIFYKSLNLYHIDNNCIFVHGGLNKNKKFNENTAGDFLWLKPPFGFMYNSNITVIYGHSTYSKVKFDSIENSIGLDTGNYKNIGKLSVLYIKNTGDILDIFEYK